MSDFLHRLLLITIVKDMKFTDYIKSLLPTFERDTILEDLRVTRGSITENLLPSYKSAFELLKGWKYKSDVLNDYFSTFNRIVDARGDYIVVMHDNIPVILDNLNTIEEMINKNFTTDTAAEGLSYLKANLLQFVEAASFVNKFARKFLHFIYVYESAQYEDNSLKESESINKAEVEWISNNFVHFCTAFKAITNKKSDVIHAFDNIPDIVITSENESNLAHTLGEKKIDPLSLRFIPVWLNPVYHVGMFIAEWQANRYKADIEERKCLQLRKLHLQRLSEGKNDAALEKQIAYMEDRIQSLNYKISKMEEKS